jgi:predicted nucleic acid-binding protein
VAIPQPVLDELRHPVPPQPVVDWANDLPEWVEVVATTGLNVDADLAELDAGEAAAIALAWAHPDSLLLMDDAKGRNEAGRRHILTIGTLGVLRDAAALGFVDLPTAFSRLAQTSFRAPLPLMDALLRQDAARTKKQRPASPTATEPIEG